MQAGEPAECALLGCEAEGFESAGEHSQIETGDIPTQDQIGVDLADAGCQCDQEILLVPVGLGPTHFLG